MADQQNLALCYLRQILCFEFWVLNVCGAFLCIVGICNGGKILLCSRCQLVGIAFKMSSLTCWVANFNNRSYAVIFLCCIAILGSDGLAVAIEGCYLYF